MNPTPYGARNPDAPFKVFRRFNDPAVRYVAGLGHRIHEGRVSLFDGDAMQDRIARALAARRALDVKEVVESFEFFERVRRRVRRPVVADLCCGHGLTGLLFAALERTVERVVLVDRSRPPSFDAALEAVSEVCPWTGPKVEFREASLRSAAPDLPPDAGVVAVHACGARTDRCLDVAVALGGPAAVMPCCYGRTADTLPRSLRQHLGRELAADVGRTLRLQAHGYEVDWTHLPLAVTAMNRVLVAWHPPRRRRRG